MIWLVGNKGMLGTEVERLLGGAGLDFVATDREVDIARAGAPGEFLDARGLQRLDWIVNCAAYTAVDKAEEDQERAFAVNEGGVVNLCSAAKTSGAALLHISTDYVFDGEKAGEYLEDDPPNPVSAYGRSKYQGEKAVRGLLDRHVILRTAWLYGRHGKNFVNTMVGLFRERSVVRVVADQWGNPTFAKDLAAAILCVIRSPSPTFGTYHFTNDGRASWHEFAKEVYSLSLARGLVKPGVEIVPIGTSEYPTAAKRPRNSTLSKEKFLRNYETSIRHWRDALESYFQEGAG